MQAHDQGYAGTATQRRSSNIGSQELAAVTVVTAVVTVVGLIIPVLTQDIAIPAMPQGTVMPQIMAQAIMALAATLITVQSLIMAPCLASILVGVMTITNIQTEVLNVTKMPLSMVINTPSMGATKHQTMTQLTMAF